MNEERWLDFEESHARLQREVEVLSDVVAGQQRELDELRKEMEILAGRYRDLRDGLASREGQGEDPLPPHYLPR